MNFIIQKNKNKGYRVTINIPKKIVQTAILKEFIHISKSTHINGFRKGKIPINIIQKKYSNTVYYDVFKKLMQKFFYEFIDKEKIKIIGTPKYNIDQNEYHIKKYLKYSVDYEIYPNFQIKNLNLMQIEKLIVNISDEDIKKYIKKYKRSEEVWITAHRKTKKNDRVLIDYSVFDNIQELKKFNKKNVKLIISKNTLIPELNEKIINHSLNDIIFFYIVFSSFHPEQELRNKKIIFKIKIKKIEEKNIQTKNKTPEQKKIEKKLINKYEEVKKNIMLQIEELANRHLQVQIIQSLLKNNPINIPPLLLQEEIKTLNNKNTQEYKIKKHSILEKKYHDDLKLKAKNKLNIRIIMQKIIFNEKISPNAERMQKLIKQIALNYKKPLDIINLYNKNNNLMESIKNMELEMQVMNFLFKKVNILEKKWNFNQILNYKFKNDEELFG